MSLPKCPMRQCKSRIPVQARGTATTKSSPKGVDTAKKKGRCGECPGCAAMDCGDCPYCEKKALGEPLRSNQYCANKKCDELEAAKEKKPKTKRSRCGVCEACKMQDGCGKCATCLKNYPHLCPGRRCTNPIITEVVEKEKNEDQPGHGATVPTAPRGRRCQECDGCKADPCGTCNACEKTPDNCKARECTNRIVRGANRAGPPPIVQNKKITTSKKGSNPRRYKRCGVCEGCKVADCGSCQSCRHNKEYADQLLAPISCENIVCDDPLDLYGTNHLKALAEDGTCPTKVIMGKLYDFRCYFCKTLPRIGSANRSELYRHYAVMHYVSELKCEFGRHAKKCPLCSKDVKNTGWISHLGQVHDEVHKYLPEGAKIPRSVQGKGKGVGGRGTRRAVHIRNRYVSWDFPDIPECFNPHGDERTLQLPQKEPEVIVVDKSEDGEGGFEIYEDVDADEPLAVSREETYKPPDYSGSGARCIICKSNFPETIEAILHIHKAHNIKGGSLHPMLDADRLLKAGYLKLCYGDTATSITEKGEYMKIKVHRAFRATPPNGLVRLIGEGLPNDTKPPVEEPKPVVEGEEHVREEEEGVKEGEEGVKVEEGAKKEEEGAKEQEQHAIPQEKDKIKEIVSGGEQTVALLL